MKLSEHFTTEEFACKCGCGFDTPVPELVQALELIRTLLDAPMTVTSGCRCLNHNAAIGGDAHSWHMVGQAADIHAPDKKSKYRLVTVAIGSGVTDIGVYDWGLHFAVGTALGLWRGK